DRVDSVHPFVHRVARADGDVRPLPDSDAARDLAAADSLAQPLGEHHALSLAPFPPSSSPWDYHEPPTRSSLPAHEWTRIGSTASWAKAAWVSSTAPS